MSKAKKSRKKTPKKPAKLRHKKARKLSKIELLTRQVSSLQKRLKKYEGQRFQGPLAPGKKPRKAPRTQIDAVRSRMKLFLENSKRLLEAQDIGSRYRSHENADQSIDAEIRVPVEEHGDIESHLIDLEDAGKWNDLEDFWIMIGLQVEADEATGSPTIDKRPQRAWTNPVRGNRSGGAFFTARETVVRKLEEWGASVSGIVVRLFWHPHNDRPHRPRK